MIWFMVFQVVSTLVELVRSTERLSKVVPLARENDWGFERIEGELLKLGYTISHETVDAILRRYGIPPTPERETSPSWRHLMTHYKNQLLACDFFTVETLFLQTLYVFVEIGSSRRGKWINGKNGFVVNQ
jgi:hypothetical protein